MLQRPAPGIPPPITGDKYKVSQPPDTKAAQGNELKNRRAISADVKTVRPERPKEKRQEKRYSPASRLGSTLAAKLRLRSEFKLSFWLTSRFRFRHRLIKFLPRLPSAIYYVTRNNQDRQLLYFLLLCLPSIKRKILPVQIAACRQWL